MLYFAYGSNLDPDQMRTRCPNSRFVCVARLAGYRLAFTRYSPRRECGVADVVEYAGGEVWGAVYEIDGADIAALDACEGCKPGQPGNSYERVMMTVAREGDAGPIEVAVYIANPQPGPPPPSAEYLDLIIDGARHCQLPQAYIERLATFRTTA